MRSLSLWHPPFHPASPSAPCCSTGYTAYPEYTITITLKEGDPYSFTLGEMTSAEVWTLVWDPGVVEYVPRNVTDDSAFLAWYPSLFHDFWVSGGDDRDVCIHLNPPGSEQNALWENPYLVPIDVSWSGSCPGISEPLNPRFFTVSQAPRPGDGSVDSYSLSALCDDTGDCNRGNEQESASTTVGIYY